MERLKARMGASQGALLDLTGETKDSKDIAETSTGSTQASRPGGTKRRRAKSTETAIKPKKDLRHKKSATPFRPVTDLELALEKSERMKNESSLYEAEIQEHARQNKYGDVANLHASTLIFAQEEGGSAVVVTTNGDILTCSHCLGSEAEIGSQWCLLFGDGGLCLAEAYALDERADLALLRIVGLYDDTTASWTPPGDKSFACVEVCAEDSASAATLETTASEVKGKRQSGRKRREKQDLPIMCIGQSIVKRNLNVCISTGQYLGIYDCNADIR
jgi:hypothetical protein